ncbi:hypothetical protein WL21_04730 [Burkholderia ubonensis]|uniref:type III secretion system translocon subunit SctE n=1 Tax=Burkholderia ubonensis TaxID=101571 RepID=UPI0007522172|nr:type III secretion system translocon subunit SctE [Burkholderia ubonensis]KVO87691.1 hypothetical protein WJ81_15700 [Burkholderia ubonensis]KVZ57308.1 hypothetical protein WL20_23485 [Burkholderia ubonensis]KVZ73005.1 hypothetical protein WL21_04730 [Burkholderia ubonensis]
MTDIYQPVPFPVHKGVTQSVELSPSFVSADPTRAAFVQQMVKLQADVFELMIDEADKLPWNGAAENGGGQVLLRKPAVDPKIQREGAQKALSLIGGASPQELAERANEMVSRREVSQREALERAGEYEAAVSELEERADEFDAALGQLAQRGVASEAPGRSGQARFAQVDEAEVAQVRAARSRVLQSFDGADTASRKVPDGAADGTLLQRDVSTLEKILTLFARYGEMLAERGENRIEVEGARIQAAIKDRAQKMQDELKRVEQENAKAQELNKTAGCLGKIIGAVVTAVSVVAAVFTGGASLAVAGIGVALMVADSIVEATTGTSFIAKALEPLMALLQPVLDFLAGAVADLLQSFGVDESIAKMIAMVAVAVALAAAVVALSVTGVGGAVVSGLGRVGSVVAKGMEKTLGKMIPEVMKHGARRMAAGLSQIVEAGMGRIGLGNTVQRQVVGSRLTQGAAVMNAAQTAAVGGLNIAAEVHRVDAAKSEKAMTLADHDQKVLTQMMQNLIELIATKTKASLDMFALMSRTTEAHHDSGVAIARTIAA